MQEMQETQETQVQSLEQEMQPTSAFLPGKYHRQRSLAGYSPWGCRESDTTEQLSMNTHSLFYTQSLCLLVPSPYTAPPPFPLPTYNH